MSEIIESENGCMVDLAAIRAEGAEEERESLLTWLDAEIEAARQLQRSDPIATRSALERVKARLTR